MLLLNKKQVLQQIKKEVRKIDEVIIPDPTTGLVPIDLGEPVENIEDIEKLNPSKCEELVIT